MHLLKLLKKLKEEWKEWELRSFILLSLFLQIFINLFAPLRKRTVTTWVTVLIWVAYLLSDSAANYAVGLISSSQKDSDDNSDLLAFWAPFLMVHLGGPDNMTAYAVEDNKLWLRHLFFLILQSLSAIHVFIQSQPKNELFIPNVLMLIFGFYKYAERTVSLYNARTDSDDYTKLLKELDSNMKENIGVHKQMIDDCFREKKEQMNDDVVVQIAYGFFEYLRDFTADFIVGVRERNWFRNFLLQLKTSDKAFQVIEVELNFTYEVLFTKVGVVYSSTYGYCARFISFALLVASFLLFHYNDKKGFQRPDISITYTLLIGAIVLEATAFIKIFFSDWYKARNKNLSGSKGFFADVLNLLQIALGKIANILPSWGKIIDILPVPQQIRNVLKRRWSENVSAYSLIACCLNSREPELLTFIEWWDLTDLLDSQRNVKSNPFKKDLKDHIFGELLEKSKRAVNVDIAKEITAARGSWILKELHCDNLLPYVAMDFDQSLLTWHIATEICYYDDEKRGDEKKYRYVSKILSDYMVYLLIKQPAMMSAVDSIGEIRFRDTMKKAKKKFFKDDATKQEPPKTCPVIIFVLKRFLIHLLLSPYKLLRLHYLFGKKGSDEIREDLLKANVKEFCEKILGVVDPDVVKGDESVLFDGCKLAQKMIEMERGKEVGDKWEVLSKVWVEMLCYAAMHCSLKTHAIQLTKGGELATLVWLLMIHFGFGNQFRDEYQTDEALS